MLAVVVVVPQHIVSVFQMEHDGIWRLGLDVRIRAVCDAQHAVSSKMCPVWCVQCAVSCVCCAV